MEEGVKEEEGDEKKFNPHFVSCAKINLNDQTAILRHKNYIIPKKKA